MSVVNPNLFNSEMNAIKTDCKILASAVSLLCENLHQPSQLLNKYMAVVTHLHQVVLAEVNKLSELKVKVSQTYVSQPPRKACSIDTTFPVTTLKDMSDIIREMIDNLELRQRQMYRLAKNLDSIIDMISDRVDK